MKNEPFVIERVLKAPVEKVWKALTDKDQMKQWYFDIAEFKPEVGFKFTFTGENEGRVYVHLCTVKAVEINNLLAYIWRYEDQPGDSLVTIELFPLGETTKIRLTHSGLETFPQNNPDFARENFVNGWTYIIGTSIGNFVEK